MSFNASYSIIALDRFSAVARKIGASTKGLEKKISSASRKMSNMGKKMSDIGKNSLVKLTLPIGVLGGVILKTAADFELGMNQVQAMTGATGTQFDRLKDQALFLGRTTKFSATEAAGGMNFLAKAGFSAQKVLAAMPETLILATAANLDLASSADIVTNIMTGYGVEAKDLGRTNDILVKAFTSSNTDLQQLGQSFKFAGTIASSMGIKFSESAAILGTLGNAGIQAGMAGTSLRKALSTLAAPSRQVVKILKKLKIKKEDILDSKGNVKSLIDTIGLLEKQGANAGDLMTIFGQRAGPAMAALVKKGSKSIRAFQKDLEDSGGTAKRIAAVQMKGLTGAWRTFKSTLEGVYLKIAESGLKDFGAAILNAGTKALRFVMIFSPGFIGLLTAFLGIIAAIPVILIGLGVAMKVASLATAGFSLIVSIANGKYNLMVKLQKAWTAVTWLYTTAASAASVATNLGLLPLTLIALAIGAVIAAIVALIKYWDVIANKLKSLDIGPLKLLGTIMGKISDFSIGDMVGNMIFSTEHIFKDSVKQTAMPSMSNLIGGVLGKTLNTSGMGPISPEAAKPLMINNQQSKVQGEMNINLKDPGNFVENVSTNTFGNLNLGVSGI